MTASDRHRQFTTPLGERVEQRGIMATATALAIAAIGASAGAPVASASLSSRGNTKAAKSSADAATRAAEIQAASAKEALDFTKQQDTADRLAADKAARLNYDQWATQQRRIGTLGEMLGVGGRNPGPYDSVISPSSGVAGGGTAGGGATGGAGTMPGEGEVDWTAAPDVLGKQLTSYYTKRGVAASEVPYWVAHAGELVQRGQELNDPNYANMRLSMSEVFGGPTYGGGKATSPGKKIATTPASGLGAYVAGSYRSPNRYVSTPTLASGGY